MKPRVLIVDDSLTVRMDLGEAFERAGFEALLCATGETARQALASRGADVVVLDVLLPDTDGIELLREIRDARASEGVPVLLLSTEAEVRDRIRGLKTGADEYVGKPYDAGYVVARARELVRRREAGGAEDFSPDVLLIDDSATFREELKAALQARGYRVASAATGEEGLRMAADLRPRAVVVDGVLPGIDGPTVIRRLRQDASLRRTPCVLLTASGLPGGELQALDAGADAYLRKDEDVEVLRVRLDAMLRFAAGAEPVDAPSGFLGPKKILAVDDSLTYLQELAAQLRQEGYDPVLARSGEEALELLGVQPVDCVLLDLLMPGLSGHETCRRIKGSPAFRGTPVVILTALEERDAMIEGINAGADDYIPKSSDFDVLKARLRAQLRRKQFEDENRSIREDLLKRELEAAEARAAQDLAQTRGKLLKELERKNEELEAFTYSVSHDLRAPLRAIDGFSMILAEECAEALGDEGKRLLRIIRENTGKLAQLIDDLLEFSRMGRRAMHLSRVDMTTLASTVVREVVASCPERKVEAWVGALPEVRGDAALLRQVYVNLIGNAVKYSRPREVAKIEVGGRPDGTENLYFVRDNGVGFDMEYAHKLFGIFQRLHAAEEFEGTGVGLAIVQRVVQRHDGRVWAEGKPKEGATFYFALPREGATHDRLE